MPVLEIYGDIGENYWEPEASITGKSVSAWLKANAEGASEITVLLNSYGGAVSDGVTIHNLLSQHPARVVTRVMGFALSAASVIAMAGDQIEMLPGTMMMIHPASGMAWGTAEDMESTAKALRSMSDASAQIYADRTGKSKEECLALMDAETWMQPSEALSLGFCDKVISGKSKPAAATGQATRAAQRWVQSYRNAPDSIRALMSHMPDALDSGLSLGDRVQVRTGLEHEGMHAGVEGTIQILHGGPAVGIVFDGMAEVHKWYAPDEIEVVAAEQSSDAPEAKKKKPMGPMKMVVQEQAPQEVRGTGDSLLGVTRPSNHFRAVQSPLGELASSASRARIGDL